MTILFSDNSERSERIFAAIRKIMPTLDIRRYPDTGDKAAIRYALVWQPEAGSLSDLPNLAAIFTLSAGVDRVIDDPAVPAHIPLIRNTAPELARGIAEYAVYHVLRFYRDQHRYEQQQRQRIWEQLPQRQPESCTVGLMGYGVTGRQCAAMLRGFGFPLRTWSASPKHEDGIRSFHGDADLPEFLAGTDILVNTLPLTARTTHILDASCFAAMKKNSILIHVGRGKHLVESDLLDALENGPLAHAVLDVFEHEPLPPEHPFWNHPQITVTPHIASIGDIRATLENMLRVIGDFEQGRPLAGIVDRDKGY